MLALRPVRVGVRPGYLLWRLRLAIRKASRTALIAAFFRAHHHQHDDPKIFDNPFAHLLLSASEVEFIENGLLSAGHDKPDVVLGVDRRTTLSRLLRRHPAPAAVLAILHPSPCSPCYVVQDR